MCPPPFQMMPPALRRLEGGAFDANAVAGTRPSRAGLRYLDEAFELCRPAVERGRHLASPHKVDFADESVDQIAVACLIGPQRCFDLLTSLNRQAGISEQAFQRQRDVGAAIAVRVLQDPGQLYDHDTIDESGLLRTATILQKPYRVWRLNRIVRGKNTDEHIGIQRNHFFWPMARRWRSTAPCLIASSICLSVTVRFGLGRIPTRSRILDCFAPRTTRPLFSTANSTLPPGRSLRRSRISFGTVT